MEIPFFSVVIPTYKRPGPLQDCLAALSRLDYPRDRFEVIVVNDGDPTLSESAVAPYQSKLNIQLLFQPNAGPAGARNTGAKRAKGQLLAFTDDDCRPASDWLRAIATYWHNHSKDEVFAVGGEVINALSNNLYAAASQLHGDAVYAYFNRQKDASTFFASCNFAVPREAYLRFGGFDERFPIAAGEDRAFCDRWLREGHSLRYVAEAQIYHAHSLTFWGLMQQHFNYGRGAFFFHQARVEEAIAPVKTDLKFYWHLVTYPFKAAYPFKAVSPFRAASLFKAVLLSALFIGCNLAKTVGFFQERLKHLFAASPFIVPEPLFLKQKN